MAALFRLENFRVMNISPATVSDIPELCELLELLFSEEAEFHPNHAAQSAGLLMEGSGNISYRLHSFL